MHQRNCKAKINQDVEEEETDGKEEDNEPEQNEQEEDKSEQPPNAEKENHDDIIMDRVHIFERVFEFFGV